MRFSEQYWVEFETLFLENIDYLELLKKGLPDGKNVIETVD